MSYGEKFTVEKVKEYLERFKLTPKEQALLIAQTHDADYIKQCLNNDKFQLESGSKKNLIISTGDSEFIKQSINNEKFNFNTSQKIDLIIATKDFDFIKESLNNDEINSSGEVVRLIKATEDAEFIMQCLNSDKYGFSEFEKKELIKATNNPDSIKQFLSKEMYNLPKPEVVDLIKQTKDADFIKQCINDEKLNLRTSRKVSLIIATEDVDFIKESLNNNFDSIDKVKLIAATKDADFIMECLEKEKLDPWDKVILIRKTKNPDLIKKYIEKEDLEEDDKIDLIIATGDVEYMKQSLKNNEFDLTAQIRLVKETRDLELINLYLKNDEIDLKRKWELIKETKDMHFIMQNISNNELNFDMWQKVMLIKSIENPEMIEKCLKNESVDKGIKTVLSFEKDEFKFYKEYQEKYKQIEGMDLPKEMTIGIEIESEGPARKFIPNIRYNLWRAERDGSLFKGVEMVSPILKSNERDSQDIYVMCNMLKDMGQVVSERCGGHIHIGADYLSGKESYSNLLAIWGNAEKVIYQICNPGGETIRSGALLENSYAAPISGKLEKAIEEGTLNLDSEQDLDAFVSELKKVQGDRYSGINFENIGEIGKNTIEFRLSNGTINPKTWIENINLFGGIVKAAEEITQINQKSQENQTEEEKEKLEAFGRLCSGELEEKEILDELLKLSVSEKNKSIYEERYEVNKGLYKTNTEIEQAMKSTISKKTIKAKEIGKGVFSGKSAITGTEILAAEERLSFELSIEQQKEYTQEIL